jgi:hypothetical protein
MTLQKLLCKLGLHNYSRLKYFAGEDSLWVCQCGRSGPYERY